MAEPSRYNVSGYEFVNGDILKNKLNIKDKQILEDTETILLNDSYNYFLDLLNKGEVEFNLQLIFEIHKYFLGTLYEWAGKIRAVEISKDGILFCAYSQIPNGLKELEKILNKNVPKKEDSKKMVSEKLSFIHCEFNAIHPFREGNGRTIRLFLDLLAVNSGFNLIDFELTSTEDYIKACKLGMKMNYGKMTEIIQKGLKKLS